MATPARVDELLDDAGEARVELSCKVARGQGVIQSLRRDVRELGELFDELEAGLAGLDEFGQPGELAAALTALRESPALRRGGRKVRSLHRREAAA